MGDTNFESELKQRVEYIEGVLKSMLPKEEGYAKTVIEAMNYSLMAGGKRLRPMMMYEAYKLFAGDSANDAVIHPFMTAMEMIHTYSLVHDDLPAMDNDEYRRGRKTTHAVYGAGMATLAGDGLLNLAFETAIGGAASGVSLPEYDGETSNRYVAALKVLSTKAGIYGMVGGQCADIMAENTAITDKEELGTLLRYIDDNKTGALIESSLMIGAILGGASAAQVKAIERAGNSVGVAFQIQDDILDIVGNLEELGKPIGSDEKNQKTTYVSLYGMDEATAKVKELSDAASDILKELGFKDSFLDKLFQYLIYRRK
ncbi:MAG: polyprenyl synthetase family protein [Butyrivibrio sp.]|nr:polyprenyl synthetase family protein [Butyrivibrio sp.]